MYGEKNEPKPLKNLRSAPNIKYFIRRKKCLTLLDNSLSRPCTEPRDLYHIHYLLTNQMVDVDKMVFGMGPKFGDKGLAVGDLRTVLARRRASLNQLWTRRLAGQMPEIPSLEKVIREMNRFFSKQIMTLIFEFYRVVILCQHLSFRAKKYYLISQSEFFGFKTIAGPKVAKIPEHCSKVSGFGGAAHNPKVAGSSPAPATNNEP
jgi:hypothetical protein